MIDSNLIAPCGMNCSLCLAYQRDKKRCLGCNSKDTNKPNSCRTCIIQLCDKRANITTHECIRCIDYPCKRLKQLDKRYREKYNMSMLDNLSDIQKLGMNTFLQNQETKYKCKTCGELICVHRNKCMRCNP